MDLNDKNKNQVDVGASSFQMVDKGSKTEEVDNISQTSKKTRCLHFSNGTLTINEDGGVCTADHGPSTPTTTETPSSADKKRASALKRASIAVSTINSPTINNIANFSVRCGKNALKVCDYVGGSFASMLGITDPKYHAEYEEYKRQQSNETRRQTYVDREYGSWNTENRSATLPHPITTQDAVNRV